jgi:hypothetical protein
MNGGGVLVEAVSNGREAVPHDECSTEHSRHARWRGGKGMGTRRRTAWPQGSGRLEVRGGADRRAPAVGDREREEATGLIVC